MLQDAAVHLIDIRVFVYTKSGGANVGSLLAGVLK
jgi:hypothetical protein